MPIVAASGLFVIAPFIGLKQNLHDSLCYAKYQLEQSGRQHPIFIETHDFYPAFIEARAIY